MGYGSATTGDVRVLVVDDSMLMRRLLTGIINNAEGFTVVGAAASAEEGWDAIQETRPDVVTLDLELPGRHGLALLNRLMRQDPLPVLVVSAFGGPGADNTIQALELGAVDFIEKPDAGTNTLEHFMETLLAALRRAAGSRKTVARVNAAPRPAREARKVTELARGHLPLVAIGASTGGVPAVQRVLRDLAPYRLPVVVTQHMPPGYTGRFAARLEQVTGLTVREAAGGERLEPGTVYIAPGGNRHMEVVERGSSLSVSLVEGPLVSGHRPSVDVMFHSVARLAHHNSIGVLLTGMGRDGAQGLLAMRKAGSATLIQSEETCVVYGMPKAAFEIGAADHVVPLDEIANDIYRIAQEPKASRVR
ncbi:chemotaxis response regulator protein-glutamate methylesterase [Chelatococcus sp. SYSU_G07232]|uniref:Protein-glutamate methylesterase/protein-glutamine glutaminase n=1 Tax=Chelatococcus albus TaxID=3047466 RepID=A0ABT7AF89_9HYPH|nr:chemotaxis response regulator protein-glutamate methylesterase [Chelatococcus sp. SYSU_G07232]MDJ1158043.1 chemotaxis response regulator protein-glutamate methylesterase [Chelatococcus sp. SYSU_G07232]